MFIFLKTKNEYKLDEVSSSLQKSLRRGMEKDAMYWALEMCPKYERYLWKRLQIISYEDVSALAPGNIPLAISVMKNDYFNYREKGEMLAPLILANAILLLARSPKNRIADNFITAVSFLIDNGWKEEIPDYALDKHTSKGRQMGRGGKDFVDEGTRLENEFKLEGSDDYKDIFSRALNSGAKLSCLGWSKEKIKKTAKKEEDEI
jgi:replication-associated recombination protein RarA